MQGDVHETKRPTSQPWNKLSFPKLSMLDVYMDHMLKIH
jgi:hypothetical protein